MERIEREGFSVYLRELELDDAKVSVHWRNNPKIWRLTEHRPDQIITVDMEKEWITNSLKSLQHKRFAICLLDGTYIGNVSLLNIKNKQATLHTFLGEVKYWGGARAYEAICLVFDCAFQLLQLNEVETEILKNHTTSLKLATDLGFQFKRSVIKSSKELLVFGFTKNMYYNSDQFNWDDYLKHKKPPYDLNENK